MRKLGMLIMLFLTILVSISFGATPVMAFRPQPEPPADVILGLTIELRGLVEEADTGLFRGALLTYAERLQSALVMKIHEVCMMFEMENWYGGHYKLERDIKPKVWNPYSDDFHKRSWLNPLYPDVLTFVERCQGIIEEINMYLTALDKGIVEVEPSTVKIGDPVTINLILKSYEPTTVTVSSIDFENYVNGEPLNSGTIWSKWPGWITGTVPPYQEVIIYSEANTLPVGSWEMRVVFHTSSGDFPASGSWTVLP